MPVDPKKKRIVLAVHGVQSGTDEEINCHKDLKKLIKDRLGDGELNFDTKIYKYENINDKALDKVKKLFSLFRGGLYAEIPVKKMIGGVVTNLIDVIGDVLINLEEGTTAREIRDGLIKIILKYYKKGNMLYLVAHSLGSIYAFDAVNEFIKKEEYFDRNDRKTWPVQALVTLGSPIGIELFKGRKIENLGEGREFFRWRNYWARTDPVVSGNIFGIPIKGYKIAEKFSKKSEKCGWDIQDKKIDAGKAWVQAHSAYWKHPGIGDDLISLISS
jgi:hypothetical protein